MAGLDFMVVIVAAMEPIQKERMSNLIQRLHENKVAVSLTVMRKDPCEVCFSCK